MKKLIVLSLFAGFVFASCNGGGGEESTSTTQTTTATDTTTIVEESQVEIEREVTVDTVETEQDTINQQ
jgi:hypothetical protein